MVGEKCLLHKRELLRTQGMEDLNELRKLDQKRREHRSVLCLWGGGPVLSWTSILSIIWLHQPLPSCQAPEFSLVPFHERFLHPQHVTQAQPADVTPCPCPPRPSLREGYGRGVYGTHSGSCSRSATYCLCNPGKSLRVWGFRVPVCTRRKHASRGRCQH